MNILLFGGSFNPPHLGHQIVIEQAFELIPNLDELWLLPTYNHAFGKDLAPATDRLAMCKLLIDSLYRDSGFQRAITCLRRQVRSEAKGVSTAKPIEINKQNIKVCSIEIDHHSEGSTYKTLQLLKNDQTTSPRTTYLPAQAGLVPRTYSFLMGSDQLPTFNKWGNWENLLKEMHFYVYPRGSHRHDVTFPNMELLESPTQVITNISSTLIRERLEKHMDIHHILPPEVAAYIHTHHLYE